MPEWQLFDFFAILQQVCKVLCKSTALEAPKAADGREYWPGCVLEEPKAADGREYWPGSALEAPKAANGQEYWPGSALEAPKAAYGREYWPGGKAARTATLPALLPVRGGKSCSNSSFTGIFTGQGREKLPEQQLYRHFSRSDANKVVRIATIRLFVILRQVCKVLCKATGRDALWRHQKLPTGRNSGWNAFSKRQKLPMGRNIGRDALWRRQKLPTGRNFGRN
ncbi:hypothetical protein GXP70_27045 [Paenibacillus lycopersici]|uniref:Uncharacterized protein n=1 Tax=Paenibacillus lycopersici TaxID=2704462 RepID=A0A6C0G329_9BACL|nr:hypothetical protein [Paenibacillus lycopersici]QHT63257.1 hypothetical protein GXP70_27045 [Paenibacillus lycopersici]